MSAFKVFAVLSFLFSLSACSNRTIDLYCYQDSRKVNIDQMGLKLFLLTKTDTVDLIKKSKPFGAKIRLPEKAQIDACRGIYLTYLGDSLVSQEYPEINGLPAQVVETMIPDYTKVFYGQRSWTFIDDTYPFDHESTIDFVREVGLKLGGKSQRVICFVTDRKMTYLKHKQ